ncbi:MAG TPA: PQQ-binding-like beta-propeller repeat protein [Thermoleophilaceae bacterium]|nr:PQQ-binding-like beta-propeller repeat protein [Thermoleophilaceae bacterium]
MSPILTPGGRRRRRWPWVLGGLVLVAGVAVAAYLVFVKAPGDVSHPDVEFTAPQKAPPKGQKTNTGYDWPLYGYDLGRTRYLPGVKLRPPFVRAWTRAGSHLIEFQPVLASGRLFYQKNNGELYSVSAASGRVRWRRRVGGLSASAPAVAGGKVYAVSNKGGAGGIAGAGPGRVVALDARTGKVRWSKRLASASESSPLAHSGRLYLGSQDGTVYCLLAKSGRIVWRYKASGAVKAGPAFSANRVFVAAYGGTVTALRASNGSVIWRSGTSGRSFGRAGNFYGTPAVAFGRVYAGNTDGRVYSFAASSGKLAWSHSMGAFVYGAAAVADVPGMRPAVFVGSYSGRFSALDARSGAVIWNKGGYGKISGAPSVIGDVVYFSSLSQRRTYALGARTGRTLWSLGRGAFNPAISDGIRVYITGYGSEYAFTTKAQLAKDRADQRRLRRAGAKKR